MKITAIIVLYNTKINESKTLNSIRNISGAYSFVDFNFIIYDNSLISQHEEIEFPFPYMYYHDETNGGLATAYNYALNYCIENNTPWLLLLDQDTELRKEYFLEIEKTLKSVRENADIVSIIPQIICNNNKISPVSFNKCGFVKEINKKNSTGIYDIPVTGINSGTLLSVDFINSIGGFNLAFRIDMLDYWYFQQINRMNKKVYVLESQLEHSLSVMNYADVSVERYKNIIKAEHVFFRDYCSRNDFFIFKLRLILRLIKQLIKVENKEIAYITYCNLIRKYE